MKKALIGWVSTLGVLLASLLAQQASAKTIHVSGTGSDKNDGSTSALALRSLQAAANATKAGDVVEVDDGNYDPFSIKNSGTDLAWIRFVAKAGAKPKVQSSAWNAIYIESAHHIEIRGFEVIGAMASRTLDQCVANGVAGVAPDPACNGNGISIDSRAVDAKAHHVLIVGNDVHDCPGAGISAIQADYVTVEDNFVHETSWHTRYASSGISYLNAWNFDDATTVKMIVRRNRVFRNKTLVKWTEIDKLSDGNGIIIDSARNVGLTPPLTAYKGRFLVEDNLSVGNGGSGIHAYHSDHVDIIHNTTYQNGQVVGYAEIFANSSDDVHMFNNVMIGRTDGDVNSKPGSSTATYDYNVYFGGKVAVKGANDVVADPKVLSASLDPLVADFRLASDSPALDTATTSLTSPFDLTGASRPVGKGPDRGAYERGAVTGGEDAGADASVTDGSVGDTRASDSDVDSGTKLDGSPIDGGDDAKPATDSGVSAPPGDAEVASPGDGAGCGCVVAGGSGNRGSGNDGPAAFAIEALVGLGFIATRRRLARCARARAMARRGSPPASAARLPEDRVI